MTSVKTRFGFVAKDGNGNALSVLQVQHPTPWRGYSYSAAGHLEKLWEHGGQSGRVNTASLRPHILSPADVARVGGGAKHWTYNRDSQVGSLQSNQGGAAFRSGNVVRTLGHDTAGRLTTDGDRTFRYDERNRLSAVG